MVVEAKGHHVIVTAKLKGKNLRSTGTQCVHQRYTSAHCYQPTERLCFGFSNEQHGKVLEAAATRSTTNILTPSRSLAFAANLYVYSSLAMLACPSILPSVCRSVCQAMDTHIKCETKMCPLQKGHAIIIYTRGRTMVVRGTWPKKKNYSVATRNPIQSKPMPTTGTGIFK